MAKFVTKEILEATVFTPRWGALAKAGVDLQTYHTWDPALRREHRILVPIDVQAFVSVPEGEQVVPIGGVLGDPDPFADPGDLPVGVHLHWALPDSLLSGSLTTIEEGDGSPEGDSGRVRPRFPALPDRWVVVRILTRSGQPVALTRGWVIDARTGGVEALDAYSGGAIPARSVGDVEPLPAGARLDATARETLLWSGTYAGARGRFTFHDPLTDLPGLRETPGLAARAAYLVAGWYGQDRADPLHEIGVSKTLEQVLAALRWSVSREESDRSEKGTDPWTKRGRDRSGLEAPVENVMETVTSTGTRRLESESIAPGATPAVGTVRKTVLGRRPATYRTLLHGSVIGVPVDGTATGHDARPAAEAVSGAIGLDLDDIAAALAGEALAQTAGTRRSSERLMAAFTSGLLSRLGTPDGLFDLDEHEHTDTFSSAPGRPLPGAHVDVLRTEDGLPVGPGTVGRKGRGAMASPGVAFTPGKGGKRQTQTSPGTVSMQRESSRSGRPAPPGGKPVSAPRDPRTHSETTSAAAASSREVIKAAPRIYRPAAPLLGLRGAHPSNRHHHDASHDGSGRLVARRLEDVVTAHTGIVEGSRVLPTLGSGAVPDEVLPLARETLLLDGYAARWLVAAAPTKGQDEAAVRARVGGELLRLYGEEAIYDGTGVTALVAGSQIAPRGAARRMSLHDKPWLVYQETHDPALGQVAAILSGHSLLEGMAPSPVALTTWAQPWCPLFVEWEVRVEGREDLRGWRLGETDLEDGDEDGDEDGGAPTLTRTMRGRAPLTDGVGKTLVAAIRRLLEEGTQGDAAAGPSSLSAADAKALGDLAGVLAPLGVVSATLDGVREQLLGIASSGMVVRTRTSLEDDSLPEADAAPVPLFGGVLTVTRLRLVDTFGRILPVQTDKLPTTLTHEIPGRPASLRLRPRLQHGARWLLRLVDPAHPISADPAQAAEAWVDQVRPHQAVNPVSGYLLPDHIDEACEVFDRDGSPLGQIGHDGVSGAVLWEPAPGRPVPPSAGPLHPSTPAHAQLAARIAAGLVQADIDARSRGTTTSDSALSAFLRAIDSTLWSVDTYAALGSPSIAGLVGRPLAVVRATLRLEAPDDLDDVRVTAADGAAGRRAAFEALGSHRFPVRLGALGRSDDATVGFFVDDDYTRLRVVDRVVAAMARQGRRHQGMLGMLGQATAPEVDPIEHPYIDPDDTIEVTVGQVVRLTILMLPGGRVHLTSGIAPRKSLSLAEDWVSRGLARISPSLRVGPVLVDPAEIRLPKVASLGPDQTFTRRTGPLTWRDDPITAATSAALLPRMPHEAQEGWIRVTPIEPKD